MTRYISYHLTNLMIHINIQCIIPAQTETQLHEIECMLIHMCMQVFIPACIEQVHVSKRTGSKFYFHVFFSTDTKICNLHGRYMIHNVYML